MVSFRWSIVFIVLTAGCFRPANAAVDRIEIIERGPFANGAQFGSAGTYEWVRGRLHFAVNPGDPANARIVDLSRAPTDKRGMVTYRGDFLLLTPRDPARRNRRLLFEVGNRGNIGMLSFFNDAPTTNHPLTITDAGNGFLFRRGYSLLWTAWNWDVTAGDGRFQIELPIARENKEAIFSRISAEITVNWLSRCEPLVWGNSRGYPPVTDHLDTAVLTVRNHQRDLRTPVATDQWHIGCSLNSSDEPNPAHLYFANGFKPGRLYELIYVARDPRIVGLGLAAIRDSLSFFRFENTDLAGSPNPLAGEVDHTLIFGISQSGRVIQHLLYEGMHVDEVGRMVFDGALVHVAGAGKGSFNHRFAQTTRHPSVHEDHQYPADFFPFATTTQKDPLTGARGDVLVRARELGLVPKIIYTGTSSEYWTRASSLLHTDVDGTVDIPLDHRTRLYVFTGAQHGVWAYSDKAYFDNCINPLDYRPPMRALLLHLDRWIADGVLPPESVYPRIKDNTLGSVSLWKSEFPLIANLKLPRTNLAPPRLSLGQRWSKGIIDTVPPDYGLSFVTLVPMPDRDGIDMGGVRLPAVAAPLGTYLGWNLKNSKLDTEGRISRWSGSFIPFALDRNLRTSIADPRPSIETRYRSREMYLRLVRQASRGLHYRGFLLDEDVPRVIRRAGSFYDRIIVRNTTSDSCGYTVPGEILHKSN